MTAYGKRYWYEVAGHGPVEIGVVGPHGGEVYIVAYPTASGCHRRVKSPALAPSTHPEILQRRLDEWAKSKGLREVQP